MFVTMFLLGHTRVLCVDQFVEIQVELCTEDDYRAHCPSPEECWHLTKANTVALYLLGVIGGVLLAQMLLFAN